MTILGIILVALGVFLFIFGGVFLSAAMSPFIIRGQALGSSRRENGDSGEVDLITIGFRYKVTGVIVAVTGIVMVIWP